MAELRRYSGQMVFGLDIGTRSIVGTVGYKEGSQFKVLAQRIKEHATRAMLDGQIHDIHKVGETVLAVKNELEETVGRKLSDVCIAAAGRVLRTVTTHTEYPYQGDKDINQEDIYALVSAGIEQAYQEFMESKEDDIKFYCVGHSIVRFYLNGYPMGNLEGHKARTIGVDLIATFLPDDVVDGLYKAVELADLNVANMTLEPIAAIQLAIPDRFRMLNIALIDVGAGTSDISITNDGCIIAYGMIPLAGDVITEVIARHCLVDFTTAETVKRSVGEMETVSYHDILLLPQTIKSSELLEVTSSVIKDMAKQASEKIIELNGGKTVSAVFVVGGGGKIPGYTEALADELGIARERVALRGEEVMQQIIFEEDVQKDSLLVTPIGICLNFYEQSNNFIFVSFNETRVKIYDNNRLTVADAAMQAQFPNENLFPKRGKELNFTVNGKPKFVRGRAGEAAIIYVNGENVDIYTSIHANDIIKVQESTAGAPGAMVIGDLSESSDHIIVYVNDLKIEVPKFASVNGCLQSNYYEIKENDNIEMLNFYTVGQITEFMDVVLDFHMNLYVNNKLANLDTPVYENFSVIWTLETLPSRTAWSESEMHATEEEEGSEGDDSVEDTINEEDANESGVNEINTDAIDTDEIDTDVIDAGQADARDKSAEQKLIRESELNPGEIQVMVNGRPIVLSGKMRYVYVDVFEKIDFDLSKPRGKSIVTILNERPAQYMEAIHNGDIIEVYWKN